MEKDWKAVSGLVGEIKRCEKHGLTTAAIAMAYICIDSLASLSLPNNKQQVTRTDFVNWVNTYLKAHEEQPYSYRGKDVYAARCAFLHTYGAEAELHKQDSNIIKFVYHDGGKHAYDPDVDPNLVVIGTASLLNDVSLGAELFLKNCIEDRDLKERAESRLPNMLKTIPL